MPSSSDTFNKVLRKTAYRGKKRPNPALALTVLLSKMLRLDARYYCQMTVLQC
jgi:hypothetical protein